MYDIRKQSIYLRVNKNQELRAEKSHKHSAHETTLLQNLFWCFLNQVRLFYPTTCMERLFPSPPHPPCQLENRIIRKNKAHEALQLHVFAKNISIMYLSYY